LSKDEVELTYAKLADGTIVESATFDVGEDLFVVSEDGTKSPAPNGFHDLMLKDTEGNETLLKVKSEDGKIVERENVELADADASMEEVKDLPNTDVKSKANEVADIDSPANNSKDLKPASMMAEQTEEVGPLPTTGDGMPAENDPSTEEDTEEDMPEIEIELGKKMEEMAYRIEELEKKMMEMMKVKEEVVDKMPTEEVDMEDEELPKLDGAPVETKLSAVELNKKNYGKKAMSSQDSFLSKLYK
jgi:hypothetical protein